MIKYLAGTKKVSATLIATIVVLGCTSLFSIAAPAAHAAQASPATGQQVAAYDIPAVYQVFGLSDATMTFSQFTVDSQMNITPEYHGVSTRIARLTAELQDKIANGGEDIATAEQDLQSAGVAKADIAAAADVVQHPENYAKQESFSEKAIVQSGSAFAISEDGYLVTNSHVATISDSDVLYALISDYENATDTSNNIYATLGIDPSSADGQTLAQNLDAYLNENAKLASSQSLFKILPPSVGRTLDYSGILSDGWDADIVYNGEPYPGKDVALLKLHLNYKIPALALSSVDPGVGQEVYVIGFPGAANLTNEIENQATFTAGVVSAVRTSDSGDFPVFQTDASISEGSSGGPVLDGAGDVIGITTLGTQSGGGGGNFNFFLPVSLIKEAVNKANVTLGADHSVTNQYRHGVDLLQAGDCNGGKAAVGGLQSSLDSDFISQTVNACVPASNSARFWALVCGIGAFLMFAVVYLFYRRRQSP